MKCPKCGFVTYSGLPQCKKCGHDFAATAGGKSKSILSRLLSKPPIPATTGTSPGPSSLAPPSKVAEPTPGTPELPEPTPAPPPVEAQVVREATAEAPPPRPWREELSERVENFRRRRARLQQGVNPSTQLDMDFEAPARKPEAAPSPKVIEFPRAQGELDVELGDAPGVEAEPLLPDSLPLEKQGGGLRVLSSAAVQAGEIPLDEGVPEPEPVEIVLEPSKPTAPEFAPWAGAFVLPTAPLARRFLAGLSDALVLFLASGLFAGIFWFAGGRISPQPLPIAVLVFIAVFELLAYFGLFTALTASTPGLLSMGLEVRNFDGALPTPGESISRAFGYLVSIAALMLGFIWAAVDSEGLTWHDRISGTFITDRGSRFGIRGSA